MGDTEDILEGIEKIKALARVYYPLAPKEPISHHSELLLVFHIHDSRHEKHPHRSSKVYISRRVLKHFVERRKEELLRHHSDDEALENILFALDVLMVTIADFDRYEYEPDKAHHFYTKDFHDLGKPQLRVLLDQTDSSLEVCSIHFTKSTRNKKNPL